MADESKLLTDDELAKLMDMFKNTGLGDDCYLGRMTTDIIRYREWCKRLVDCYCHGNGDVFELAEEVRAALTISQSDTPAPPIVTERERCCFVYPDGNRCVAQATVWVGINKTKSCRPACGGHFREILQPDDTSVYQAEGWPIGTVTNDQSGTSAPPTAP